MKFGWVLLALALANLVFPVHAAEGGSVRYEYDELGRLIGVTDATGNSATYRYDAAGNILSIVRNAATQLAIMEFTPNGGSEGIPVTISGSGFSVLANKNLVKFNRTVANVIASSSTKIMTTVPAGATTGPISVATTAGTASSSTAFVVGGARAPTIVSFTPSIGVAGVPVTISGSNFEVALSKVRFNGRLATVSSAGSNNIVTSVPAGATSGRISVATPYGTALTDADFFVAPAPFSAADIQVAGRMAIGESKTVTLGTAGKKGLILFDAPAGQTVALSLSSVTLAGGSVSILSPDGSVLASTAVSVSGGFIDAKILPVTGTYTILINPSASSAGNLTLTLNAVPDVAGSIAFDGPAVTVTTTKPGQNASLTFNATAGQRFSLIFSGVKLAGGSYVNMSVFKPDGSTLVPTAYVSSSGTFVDVQTIPVAGTYTIKLNPDAMTVGSVTAQLFDVGQDPTATVAIGGPAVTVATAKPGQNASLTFSATAGQRFSARVFDVKLAGGGYVSMSVLKPDGSALVPAAYVSSSGTFIDTQTVPVTGTYTIKLNPDATAIGSLSVQLFDVGLDPTATIAIGGPAVVVATAKPGQNASLTFSATAGQRLSMNVFGVKLTSGGYLTMSVLKPDGSTLVPVAYVSPSGTFIDVQTIPVTGTYAIKLDPDSMTVASLSLQLFEVGTDPTATIAIGGPAVTVSMATPGQNASLSFSATAGQRFSTNVSGVKLTGGSYLSMSILKPDGSALATAAYVPSSGVFIDVQTIPVTGTYMIKLNPDSMAVGSVAVQMFEVVSDPTATIAIGGPAVTVTTATPGQNSSLTFDATAGQRFSTIFSGVKLAGGGYLSMSILKPDGSALVPVTYMSTGNTFIDAQTIPLAGTYTIKLNPDSMAVGSVTAQLFDVTSNPTSMIEIGGPAMTVVIAKPGQNASLTFNGAAGQPATVRITRTTIGCQTISLRRPDGGALVSSLYCGTTFNLPSQILPVAGVYTIAIDPNSSSIGSTSVALTSP
nr:IPT/TIG domain-containing protein [Rugamonas sp. CCM 8940]